MVLMTRMGCWRNSPRARAECYHHVYHLVSTLRSSQKYQLCDLHNMGMADGNSYTLFLTYLTHLYEVVVVETGS